MKRKDSLLVFALKLWWKIFTIFRTWPPKIGKIGAFGRRWQNPVLSCHFWEITHHCHLRPKMMILTIFGGQVWKIVNICHQSFNAKTDRLSFLFVMISEAWLWYYRFGRGAKFHKTDKKGLDFVSGAPKWWFWQFLAVKYKKLGFFT